MADRLYVDTPYAEPEGFWRRVLWWFRQDYHRAEKYQREQRIRADEARRIARDLRAEFPPSDIPAYIDENFGGATARLGEHGRDQGAEPAAGSSATDHDAKDRA